MSVKQEQNLKDETINVLEAIVNSCVHPNIAIRAISVDLAPIRKMITKLKNSRLTKVEPEYYI